MRRAAGTKFLRLSNRIINTSHIEEIKINPDKYTIYLNNNGFSGFILFSSGFVHSTYNEIDVCKKNNLSDYTILTSWINKNIK